MPRFNVDKNQEVATTPEKTVEPVVAVTPTMSKQEATAKLSDLVQEVYAKLEQAQKLADEHELSFGLDVEYGMGGYYEEGQWHPSSQSC